MCLITFFMYMNSPNYLQEDRDDFVHCTCACVHMNIQIDAWVFKGTATGYMYIHVSHVLFMPFNLMWSISTSQLYHGFYSAWDSTALVLNVYTSLGSALGSTYSPHALQIPYTVKTMVQLLV